MSKRALVYIHTASPLHVGSGQSLDVIDLPIVRERGTDLPYVPGSAMKGVLRAECEINEAGKDFVRSAFGRDDQPADGAGAVSFGDAKLLLFPVRSVRMLFAWVTSPYLLHRFGRDRADAGLGDAVVQAAISSLGVIKDRAVAATTALCADKDRVFVEDADIPTSTSRPVKALAEHLSSWLQLPAGVASMFVDRLLIVDDSQMGVFVKQCTEVIARISLENDTKVVKRGGLWYEEALPAESVLYGSVLAESTRGGTAQGIARFSASQHLERLAAIRSVQIGGHATVGRGVSRLSWEGTNQ